MLRAGDTPVEVLKVVEVGCTAQCRTADSRLTADRERTLLNCW